MRRPSPTPLLLSATLVLAILGGAVAGALSAQLMGGPAAPLGDHSALRGPDSALTARLEALVEENRALATRLDLLELQPASAARRPLAADPAHGEGEFVTRAELDALREELASARAAGGYEPGEPATFQDQVAVALDAIRKEQQVDKVRSSQEQWLEQLDERMPKLEQQLGLSATQSWQLRSVMLAKYDRDQELIRRWEAGVDPDVLGEEKAANTQSFQDDVSGFLSPQQQEDLYAFWHGGGGK